MAVTAVQAVSLGAFITIDASMLIYIMGPVRSRSVNGWMSPLLLLISLSLSLLSWMLSSLRSLSLLSSFLTLLFFLSFSC